MKHYALLTLLLATSDGSQSSTSKAPVEEDVLTPALAVKQPLGRKITVEFQVRFSTTGEDTANDMKQQLILLGPGILLPNQTQFEALLMGRTCRQLQQRGLIVRGEYVDHFRGAVVRVSGTLYSLGPDQAPVFRIQVEDAEDFRVIRRPDK